MLRGQIRLGRIFGIEIGLHYSWFIIAALLTTAVTPQELRAVPRDRWTATPAADAMKPLERLHRIDANEPVTAALDAIVQEDVNQLPVIEQGRIRGVISRDQILRLFAARAELDM